tara:strand:+ start:540 stop:1418 length:879 start_codon:yes stop_codon:yes gene_type:complete
MSNFRKVCIFNESFGLPHATTPQTNVLQENKHLSKLRVDLCVEEAEELTEAINTKDFTEVIDALTDELYVAYGAGSSFGIDLDNLFRIKVFCELSDSPHASKEVLDIRPSDTTMNDGEPTRTNFKLLTHVLKKTETYFTEKRVSTINSDDIFSDKFNTEEEYENLKIMVQELHQNLKRTVTQLEKNKKMSDFEGVGTNLVDILYHTYKLGIFLGIDLDASFDIVHKSNMSKLCISEQEAEDTVNNYKLNDKRYNSPEYRKSENDKYWVVFNRETGKILKSINYTQTNFSELF